MHEFDLNILYFFNRTIACGPLDIVMSFLTNIRSWIPVYAIASVYLIWRYKFYGVRIVLGVALLVGIADLVTNLFIKGLFERPRPCALDATGMHIVSWIRLPDGMRAGYSMPSSHAVNNFAAAIFFAFLFPSHRSVTTFFGIAMVVALTRPYLGLHYPSDIFFGGVGGLCLGYIFAKAFWWTEQHYFTKPKSDP